MERLVSEARGWEEGAGWAKSNRRPWGGRRAGGMRGAAALRGLVRSWSEVGLADAFFSEIYRAEKRLLPSKGGGQAVLASCSPSSSLGNRSYQARARGRFLDPCFPPRVGPGGERWRLRVLRAAPLADCSSYGEQGTAYLKLPRERDDEPGAGSALATQDALGMQNSSLACSRRAPCLFDPQPGCILLALVLGSHEGSDKTAATIERGLKRFVILFL